MRPWPRLYWRPKRSWAEAFVRFSYYVLRDTVSSVAAYATRLAAPAYLMLLQ